MDIQKQVDNLFDRKGISPFHLFHFLVFSATDKAFDMVFEDSEEIDMEEYLDLKNILLDEMEKAFIEATSHQKGKRAII